MSVKHGDLTFTKPMIGPKVYITKGPSGWPETFPRTKLDQELVLFLKGAGLDDTIKSFLLRRQIDNEPTNWATIMGYLARMKDIPMDTIPHTIGIAFWGRILLYQIGEGAN